VAFLETGALWWLYFGEVAEHSRRHLAGSEDPVRLARDAYSYLHLPIVAGIIMVAVGNDFLLAHPDRTPGGPVAAMLLGGPAAYLAGESLFRLRMIGSVSVKRVLAVLALGVLGALAGVPSALALVAAVTGVLTVLALAEYEPLRSGLRRHGARGELVES
jgi:low temperature requirement protein LtrA